MNQDLTHRARRRGRRTLAAALIMAGLGSAVLTGTGFDGPMGILVPWPELMEEACPPLQRVIELDAEAG